jgi:hypothetical protein
MSEDELGESSHNAAMVSIAGTNALTLLAALWQGWGAVHLMWVYLLQSLVLGWYLRLRILQLRDFCGEEMLVNGRIMTPTPENIREIANTCTGIIAVFNGFLLLVLLGLTFASSDVSNPASGTVAGPAQAALINAWDWLGIVALAVALGIGQWRIHQDEVATDRRRRLKLKALLALPIVRVVPPHFAVLLMINSPELGAWAFVALKTLVDLVTYTIERFAYVSGDTAAP